MTPNGPPPMTEEEYWRDYEIIKNDVHAAVVSCYTHRTINSIAASDTDMALRMNNHPDYWRVNSFSLQTTLFIMLARILDPDPGVHSIYQVLNATTAHPEFFSRAALRARKLKIPGGQWDMTFLDEYIQKSWEPNVHDLRLLKKALAPHKAKFDAIYKPIRNQCAHIIFKDEALVEDLYSKTQKTDIDEILCFLYCVMRAIQELAVNARRPDLNGDQYGYAKRVLEITNETERFIRRRP